MSAQLDLRWPCYSLATVGIAHALQQRYSYVHVILVTRPCSQRGNINQVLSVPTPVICMFLLCAPVVIQPYRTPSHNTTLITAHAMQEFIYRQQKVAVRERIATN